jgi:hypothetical protein
VTKGRVCPCAAFDYPEVTYENDTKKKNVFGSSAMAGSESRQQDASATSLIGIEIDTFVSEPPKHFHMSHDPHEHARVLHQRRCLGDLISQFPLPKIAYIYALLVHFWERHRRHRQSAGDQAFTWVSRSYRNIAGPA